MTQSISFTIKEGLKASLDEILGNHDHDKNNLISILQETQELRGFLPRNVMFYLARELEVPAAEVYGVATFYTQFKFKELGKNLIICCDGTACHVKGSTQILNYLEGFLGIKPGGTTRDEQFSLESVACLGCCAISPACIINGEIHGNMTTGKLKKILKQLRDQES